MQKDLGEFWGVLEAFLHKELAKMGWLQDISGGRWIGWLENGDLVSEPHSKLRLNSVMDLFGWRYCFTPFMRQYFGVRVIPFFGTMRNPKPILRASIFSYGARYVLDVEQAITKMAQYVVFCNQYPLGSTIFASIDRLVRRPNLIHRNPTIFIQYLKSNVQRLIVAKNAVDRTAISAHLMGDVVSHEDVSQSVQSHHQGQTLR